MGCRCSHRVNPSAPCICVPIRDVLDELNAEIEKLCAIAEGERDRILDELIRTANLMVEYGPDGPEARAEVAQLALDYAEWTRSLEGYRSLLRRGDAPIARVK